jgi:acyl dehydratase
VHCFPEVARKKGFPRAIAQGLMSHGYMSELLARRFGQQVFAGSRVKAKFIKPTPEGDTLTVSGVVKRVEPGPGGTRVFLEMSCKNQRGEAMTVGEAEITVPPAT